jgi:hypothetical protein
MKVAKITFGSFHFIIYTKSAKSTFLAIAIAKKPVTPIRLRLFQITLSGRITH